MEPDKTLDQATGQTTTRQVTTRRQGTGQGTTNVPRQELLGNGASRCAAATVVGYNAVITIPLFDRQGTAPRHY